MGNNTFIMINLLFSMVGFIPLILGANWLVDGATAVAKRKNISNLVIGLTIVAFGTSSPELIVNVLAASSGNSGFSFGNVIGSNIINILVILGLSALIYPMSVKTPTIWIEIPLCLLAALILVVMAGDPLLDQSSDAMISRSEGIILIAFFAVFMYYSWFAMKRGDDGEEIKTKSMGVNKSWVLIITGMLLLAGGGQLIVHFAEKFAVDYGISDRIIGLTILSIGTSLPELSTSFVAAFKKNADISIGNIIGSNLFNTFLILGTSATIQPILLEPGAQIDLWINVLATLLVFIFVFTRRGRKIDRVEGGIMTMIYAAYLWYILSIG